MEPAITPPEAAQRTKLGILLRVGIFAFLEIAGMMILAPLMHPVAGYLVSAALSTFGAAAIANTIAIRVYERGQLADLGLHWSGDSRWNLLLGLAGGIGAAVLVNGIPLAIGLAEFQKAEGWEGNVGSGIFIAIVLLFGAFGEELLFRGYGFQVLLGTVGEYATVLPMSVLFGLSHSNNQNANNVGVANTMLWGLLFGMAFLRSRDLWLPIGLHYGWNVTLPFFGVNLSGFTMNVTGYAMHVRMPEIWSGGDYGPEAGLLTTMAVGLLFAGLFRAPIRKQKAFLYRPDED
ncbi:MAG: CPBP family intramembrane metalloprotease [Acidobacteria bacterium]|nr:CPBP family intramembrane metalloprotease [Acidobacteriota bacterium]